MLPIFIYDLQKFYKIIKLGHFPFGVVGNFHYFFLSQSGVQLDTSPIANGYRKLFWAITIFAFVALGYKGNDIC